MVEDYKTSFEIFIPGEKTFRWSQNLTVFSTWAFTALLLWVFDDELPVNSDLRSWLIFIVGAITIGFFVIANFQYKPLNGRLDGKIIFDKDKMIVNDDVYLLSTIKQLDFEFGSYYGEYRYGRYRDFNPSIYQGVDNVVRFTDSTGQNHEVYFKLVAKNQYKSLYFFINDAVQAGAMTYYKAIDLIDAENVTKPES